MEYIFGAQKKRLKIRTKKRWKVEFKYNLSKPFDIIIKDIIDKIIYITTEFQKIKSKSINKE